MSEFTSRVDAQRTILKTANERPWPREQLFALNAKAITRWASANRIDASSRLVKLLNAASAQIFIMANHSDDPIAGTYSLTRDQLDAIEGQLKAELEAQPYWEIAASR
jgi:hypothetical protein